MILAHVVAVKNTKIVAADNIILGVMCMDKIQELEKRVDDIEKRNKREEGDKAWETSPLRKVLILILTYVFAVLYLMIADTTNPFLGAVIPCVGFYLSTQTLRFIKKKWLSKRK